MSDEAQTEQPKASSFGPMFFVKYVETLLGIVKKFLTEGLFEKVSQVLVVAGHWAIMIASVVSIVVGLTLAIQYNSASLFFYGLGAAAGLIVAQYIADKFLTTNKTLIDSSPSGLSTTSFLDTIAILAVVYGIAILVISTIEAFDRNALDVFWFGLAAFALSMGIAIIALSPGMANVSIDKKTTAGNEAIGILSFFMKSIYRMVPIIFGVMMVIGTVMLVIAMFGLWSGSAVANYRVIAARDMIVLGAAAPFGGFLIFTLYYLTIDVIRAILVLPSKLEK